jgi:hypothetical protein
MARHVEFFQQFLHGRDFVRFFVDVNMRQHQCRVDGERAEHLFCLGVVEAIETTFERLAIKRDNSRAGTRRVSVQVGRMLAKGYFNIRRRQPLQNIPDGRMRGRPFPAYLEALFSFRRWTLMKVRMPRYELAPLTIAKMENNRTCGS